MSRRELSRGNKGLWQRIEALWRSMLPRQVTVIRSEGIQVWVDATTRYPSTVAGVPAGTTGWVFTLGGKKGLFVATGIPKPVIDWSFATSNRSQTTAGTQWNTEADLVITGLMPSHEYTVKADVAIRTAGSSSRSFMIRFRAVGATTENTAIGPTAANMNNDLTSASGVARLRPDADGTITLTPGFGWSSGTVTSNWASITVTLV